MLVNLLLARTKFGNQKHEYGLETLITMKNFEDAYPLHDGRYEWSETGALNDRQVLAKYWADWRMFYKQQPIHIIHKYFGPDVAFHYAWMGFYTKMLAIPATLGICVFWWGIGERDWIYSRLDRVDEICESNQTICPSCVHPHCGYKQLGNLCEDAKVTYSLDNMYTVMFAVFMTIWATFFIEQWDRKESMYLFQWNLMAHTPEADELPNYKGRIRNFVRINKLSGLEEYYVPSSLKYKRLVISTLVSFLSVLFIISTVLVILISVHFWKYYIVYFNHSFAVRNIGTILKNYSALINIIFMKIHAPYLAKIAKKLTDEEYHRTYDQYMHSYVLKSFVTSFFNCYTLMFYTAFFKNISYTNPGDIWIYNKFFGITSDICPPCIGCSYALALLVYYTMCKNYILMIFTKSRITIFLFKLIKKIACFWKKKRQRAPQREDLLLPQWELDYGLEPENKTFFVQSFIMIVLEYGIMIFFVAAAPLLPLMALVNNIAVLRTTSINLLKHTRRNVPKRMLGIGAWKVALSIVTRVSFVISGCVIAFTSKFVHRLVYYYDHGSLNGFANETLTEFSINDIENAIVRDNLMQRFPNVNTCFFSSLKNSYNHTQKYERSDRFYQILSLQLVVLVVFVHLVYFINGLLSFSVSPVPAIIKETQAYDARRLKIKGLQTIN